MGTALIIEQLMAGLVGLINVLGSSKVVSDIIATHVASGTTVWTDAERQQVTDALAAAKAQSDADITAAGG